MARFGPLVAPLREGHVDLAARVVTRPGRVLPLTPREADLIGYLAHRGQAVSAAELLREVWGYHASAVSRTVHTTVNRVRKKIEVDPTHPQALVTEFGGSYRWAPVERTGGPPVMEVVGRAGDLARLDQAAGSFVLLVGEGGVGKTALARAWLRGRPGVEVPLALATGLADVGIAVAAALRAPRAEPLPALGRLARTRGLAWLLLDNLEQLDPAAREALPGLGVDGLRVLGTSRVPLGLPGEVALAVSPLAPEDARALLAARTAHRDLAEDPDVASLLAALGGRPLDIELAAARMAVFSPAALLRRLERPLDVLGKADGTGRHASLRTSIRWSWELLSASARRDLLVLQVFQAPFRVDAATAVLGRPAREAVEHLVAHGWLRTTPEGELAFVQAVRQFLGEVAPPSPEALRAHLGWFATYGEPPLRVALDVEGPPPLLGGRAALLRALPDLLAAARWGVEHDPERAAAALCAALESTDSGHPSGTMLALAARLGERVGRAARADLETMAACAWRCEMRYDLVRAHGARAVSLSEGLPSARYARARALVRLCGAAMLDGDLAEARQHGAAAETIAREVQDPHLLDIALFQQCSLYGYAGEFRAHHAVAVELRKAAAAAGNRRSIAAGWFHEARCLHQLGRVAEAEAAFAAALVAYDTLGSDLGAILVHGTRATMLRCDDRFEAALEAVELALTHARATRRKSFELFLLVLRAEAHRRAGNLDAARASLAEVQAEPGGIAALAAQERVQAESLRAELEEPPATALPILEACEREARQIRVELAALQILGRQVRTLVRLGRRDEARARARALSDARQAGEWGLRGNEVGEAEREAWAALGEPLDAPAPPG